jgi:hypothetical protein
MPTFNDGVKLIDIAVNLTDTMFDGQSIDCVAVSTSLIDFVFVYSCADY